MTKVSYKSTPTRLKKHNHWLECGADVNFVWVKNVFTAYKKVEPVSSETCNGIAYTASEGEASSKFDKSDIKIKCKNVLEFKENLLSL